MNELSRLCKKYVDDDSPIKALEKLETLNYEQMVKFKEGVPSGVMFAAMTASVERMTELLGGMIIDIASTVYQWDEDKIVEQLGLTRLTLRLLAADTLYETLKSMHPTESSDDE